MCVWEMPLGAWGWPPAKLWAALGPGAAWPCILLSWHIPPVSSLLEQQGGMGGSSPPVCSGLGLAASPGYREQQNSGLMMLPKKTGPDFCLPSHMLLRQKG